MSTTFVFMGMLAGREIGIWTESGKSLTYTSEHKKAIFPMLYTDFLRLILGFAISISLAYGLTTALTGQNSSLMFGTSYDF